MDMRINLSEVPRFCLDENCILMCVHKDESARGKLVSFFCLFVFSPSLSPPFHIPDAQAGEDFVQKYFWTAAHWCLPGFLRRFALLEIRVSSNCIFISLPFVSTRREKGETIFSASWLRSHTWLMYANDITPPLFDDTSRDADLFTLRFASQAYKNVICNIFITNKQNGRRERRLFVLMRVVIPWKNEKKIT